jgi:hypothetical protein
MFLVFIGIIALSLALLPLASCGKSSNGKAGSGEAQSGGKDNNQIWTHPDMVGIRFLKLQNKTSQNFLKAINRIDTFKLSSYEIKKELNSDS